MIRTATTSHLRSGLIWHAHPAVDRTSISAVASSMNWQDSLVLYIHTLYVLFFKFCQGLSDEKLRFVIHRRDDVIPPAYCTFSPRQVQGRHWDPSAANSFSGMPLPLRLSQWVGLLHEKLSSSASYYLSFVPTGYLRPFCTPVALIFQCGAVFYFRGPVINPKPPSEWAYSEPRPRPSAPPRPPG